MHAQQGKSNSIGTMATLAFVIVISYFCYHALSGERGLLALMELSKQVEQSKKQLDTANAERLRLEHRVSLLRDESLDVDLLDERARILLGYVGDNEVVYNNINEYKAAMLTNRP